MSQKLLDDLKIEVIERAKADLKAKDGILPKFFVFKHGQLAIIGAPFSNETEKDAVAEVVRDVAQDADFVIFVSEVWSLSDAEGSKDFMENRSKYPGGVQDHPKAVEKVMIHVETANGGVEMGTATILADREMADVEWTKMDNYKGRFSSFITTSKKVFH